MVYLRLIQLIEDHASDLTERLNIEMLGREETRGYRILSDDLLRKRIYDVYHRLGSWLNMDKKAKEDFKLIYTEIGRERCREGIPLQDVIMAFMLAKRNLWFYVRDMKFFDSMDEIMQALEMNNKVVYFFDRAIYFVTCGYEDQARALREEKGINTAKASS